MLKNLWLVSLCILSATLSSAYIYESNQSLIDLTNQTGITNLNAGDDQLSNPFNLDNTFTFYGNDYDSARMATNGCLHFGLGTGNVNYNSYCGDYTPDPLPQYTNTLLPFWTDLIRDNDSQMLAKNFSDKSVFGWYDMREYNRSGSDNSFEVILWNNNSYEFRYGALDVINHDVLIGEQGSSSEIYTYLFHDECNTGTTNVSGTCVNTNWNDTSSNTSLENGGSLYSDGSGNFIDCSNPLNDSSCSGYADAYLTQQCDLDSLYDTMCPLYWEAYDDQQCEEDPQYAPFCSGYTQEASVAYFVEENFDYGYEDDPYTGMELTDEEWYEMDVEEFGQEQVNEWFGDDISFNDDGMIEWDETRQDDYIDSEPFIDNYEEQLIPQETEIYNVLPYDVLPTDELTEIYVFDTIIREEIENENIHEETEREEFETLEELEEWFEEEMVEPEEIIQEQQITERDQNRISEEESHEEELEEEITEELFAEEDESKPNDERRSSVRVSALSVVASTLRTAVNSNSSAYSSAYNNSSNSSSVSTSSSSSSGSSGISTSNSPSMSDQITSANAQNNQVLSMSSGGSANVSIVVTPMPTVDDSPQMVMAEVQVQDMQGEIDTATSGVMTASEADQVADKIIANNIKVQQEEAEEEQEETGQYSDESTLVAYLGYVPAFESYKTVEIPQNNTWYEPRSVYQDINIPDNSTAFYELAGTSLNTLSKMVELQPNL